MLVKKYASSKNNGNPLMVLKNTSNSEQKAYMKLIMKQKFEKLSYFNTGPFFIYSCKIKL